MKKKIWIPVLCLALCAALFLGGLALYEGEICPVTVSPVDASAYGSLAELPVPDGIFAGWFTSEEAAQSLDASSAATGCTGTLYGAVLEGSFAASGVELRTEDPVGLRFVSTVDRTLLNAVERLSAENRKGKGGGLTPRNENCLGIGYGTVLCTEPVADTPVKTENTAVSEQAVCPGVYTYREDLDTFAFTATVAGTEVVSYADRVIARPYLTYMDANGIERTCYGETTLQTSLYAELAAYVEEHPEAETLAGLLAAYNGEGPVPLTKITALNTESSAADGECAYLEPDYSTFTALSSATTGEARYDNAHYPRITRVRDDLYLMTWNYSQLGVHLYYATSTDGLHYSAPQVLYGATYKQNKFTHTDGPLAGTEDTFYAVNADHCVTRDGEILCVYSRRANHGYAYKEYTGLNTIELLRGKVGLLGDIQWSEPVAIYHGNSWEPEIIERSNGDIEVYWSHCAPYLDMYGYDNLSEKRSSGVAMIVSKDGGYTWTPNVTANDPNHFAGKRIFQQYVGSKTIGGESVRFYSGQMPGVVELADGRMLVAIEVEPMKKDGMRMSLGYSNADGSWTELGIHEEGPTERQTSLFKGAAPTLTRFPSGEVLLTYNTNSKLYTRLLNASASNAATAYAENFFGGYTSLAGFWSCSVLDDPHTALLSMAYKIDDSHRAILLGRGRLNHTVTAAKMNAVADGNPQEWANVTDALFVGSASDVQAAYRFGYDAEKIYVLIDRTDADLTDSDRVTLSVRGSGAVTQIGLSASGALTAPDGVRGGVRSAEGGCVYELSLDRASLGLAGDSIRVCPGLYDETSGLSDAIDGTDPADASTWMKVVLGQ